MQPESYPIVCPYVLRKTVTTILVGSYVFSLIVETIYVNKSLIIITDKSLLIHIIRAVAMKLVGPYEPLIMVKTWIP